MDVLFHHFPVSGVETWIWLPPLVMFLVSSIVSMGGVSGAFVLIPFQISCLGYTSPGVSATNFVYNIVSIPVGVWHYIREGRMAWPLFWILMFGTLPGILLGYLVRTTCLSKPEHFIPFVGLVLVFLGVRTLWSVYHDFKKRGKPDETGDPGIVLPREAGDRVTGGRIGLHRTTLAYAGQLHDFRTVPVLVLSLLVGVVGGTYGIGGGAILAPFCVSVLNLPVRAVAGATLFSTWVTSIAAALVYALVPQGGAADASPDWLLGGLFGLGGMAGIYVGVRLQKVVPTAVIKAVLGVAITAVALRYLASVL